MLEVDRLSAETLEQVIGQIELVILSGDIIVALRFDLESDEFIVVGPIGILVEADDS